MVLVKLAEYIYIYLEYVLAINYLLIPVYRVKIETEEREKDNNKLIKKWLLCQDCVL